MNTPEGLLIEDGELTIHVRKASKVSGTILSKIIMMDKTFSLEVKKQKWSFEALKNTILANVTDVLWK